MDVPLNLTPARGPSVWDKPRQTAEPWQVAAVATGAMLIALGWPFRTRSSQMAASVGLAALVAGFSGDQLPAALATLRQWLAVGAEAEKRIDRMLEESFPASDPPSV